MLCALTARKLKPATAQSREAFMRTATSRRPTRRLGAVRHDPQRGGSDEAICFGRLHGTLDDLRRTESAHGYSEQAIARVQRAKASRRSAVPSPQAPRST